MSYTLRECTTCGKVFLKEKCENSECRDSKIKVLKKEPIVIRIVNKQIEINKIKDFVTKEEGVKS